MTLSLLPVFCFDTSVLIDMWHVLYPPDVIPGVWRALEGAIADAAAIAPQEVYDELQEKLDELAAWAKNNKRFFVDFDEDLVQRVQQLEQQFPNLVEYAKEGHDADPWVIALAMRRGAAVVSHEKKTAQPGGWDKPRVRIPDVCDALGVARFNVADFLRARNVSL